MRTDDETFDPWSPEPPAARQVPRNGGRGPGDPGRPPVVAGWPGSRWRLDRGTAVALVVVLAAAAAVAGFLLLRKPGSGVSVPGSAPVVSGVPVGTAPTGASGALPSVPPSGLPSGLPAGLPAGTGSAVASATDGRLRVYILGQVRRPGVVNLPTGSRVEDAVDAAGGATRKADLTAVNLARPVTDGEQIYLPRPGEEVPVAAGPVPAAGASAVPGAAAGSGAGPLDLNAATLAQLDELPGVGPVLAQRILEYRQQQGRFSQVDELGDVSGIGDATLEKLRPLVRV